MDIDNYIAKTFYGLEKVLAEEIKTLGGSNIKILNRAVSFDGSLETLYKINLSARTVLRVLKPIIEFRAHNETVLYKRLKRYDWTKLISLDQTFKINSVVNSDKFTHSRFVALKTKDAIVDLYRLKFNGQRPSIDVDHPDILIDIYCKGMDFVISIDSSGDSLHKRGYRQSDRPAPLNEALAAGMILHSKWDLKSPLLDPMCGSGTLLIEALLLAQNISPRIKRSHFSFMNWDNYNIDLWRSIRNDAIDNQNICKVNFYGFDQDAQLVKETQSLISKLGYSSFIEVKSCDFFSVDAPCPEGMIITNPPYGMRLENDEIIDFYKKIGDTLKSKYNGWKAWILSGNKEAIKSVGLRTSKKLTLYNGPIECKYHLYELYKGSKKSILSKT